MQATIRLPTTDIEPTVIGFTGPRNLGAEWLAPITEVVTDLLTFYPGYHISVGDAGGLDLQVRTAARNVVNRTKEHERLREWVINGKRNRDALVNRSMMMVESIVQSRRKWSGLIAVINRACLENVYPQRAFYGGGSGTWGTVAYATYWHLPIVILSKEYTLIESWQLPEWFAVADSTYSQDYDWFAVANRLGFIQHYQLA